MEISCESCACPVDGEEQIKDCPLCGKEMCPSCSYCSHNLEGVEICEECWDSEPT